MQRVAKKLCPKRRQYDREPQSQAAEYDALRHQTSCTADKMCSSREKHEERNEGKRRRDAFFEANPLKETVCLVFVSRTNLPTTVANLIADYAIGFSLSQPTHTAITKWIESTQYFHKFLLDVGPEFLLNNPDLNGETRNHASSVFEAFRACARGPLLLQSAMDVMVTATPTYEQQGDSAAQWKTFRDHYTDNKILWKSFVEKHGEQVRLYFAVISSGNAHILTNLGSWITKHRPQWIA